MTDWSARYMALARHVAEWSKDPSTKVGAVVVGQDRRKVAFGYNGFPAGITDTPERLADRPVKYILVQHAERNALDNAHFDLTGGTLVTTMHPCSECAKSIVTKGITHVICPPPPTRPPWAQSAEWGRKILEEAGVLVTLVP